MENDAELNRRAHDRASVEALAQKYKTWGKWGEDDELGAANRVTPESVLAAAGLIRRGVVFDMSIPLDRSGPQGTVGVRINPQLMMLVTPNDVVVPHAPHQRFADDAIYMPLQAGTQWDAFPHAFYDGHTYNGRGHDSIDSRSGAKFNSITNLTDRAVGRGVLLDIPRWKGREWLEPGEAIQDDDLEECARVQGVDVRPGDFLIIRTGQMERVRAEGSWGTYAGGPAPGLGVDAANFLCGRGVTAVASDTWGVEPRPYETTDTHAPLHVILLVHAGIYIGEMWDVAALAADCAADGIYEFFLVAQPIPVTGSVGSPITPLAIK